MNVNCQFRSQVKVELDGYKWAKSDPLKAYKEVPVSTKKMKEQYAIRKILDESRDEDIAIKEIPDADLILVPREPYMRRIDGIWVPPNGRFYDPFKDETALFYNFCELEPTKQEFLKFASQYGNLGSDLSLKEWRYRLWDLQEAVMLWEAIKTSDRSTLKGFIKWDKIGKVSWDSRMVDFYVRNEWDELENEGFRKNSLIEPAKYLLAWMFSIAPEWNSRFTGNGDGNLVLKARFPTLISIMWAQFALAVQGSTSHRACQKCSKYFELSPHANRQDRLFCSTNCRTKAFRDRKRLAKRLRLDGANLNEIAKEVKSDMPTVKKWLNNIPKGGK